MARSDPTRDNPTAAAWRARHNITAPVSQVELERDLRRAALAHAERLYGVGVLFS